jgi:hypothetical protein
MTSTFSLFFFMKGRTLDRRRRNAITSVMREIGRVKNNVKLPPEIRHDCRKFCSRRGPMINASTRGGCLEAEFLHEAADAAEEDHEHDLKVELFRLHAPIR